MSVINKNSLRFLEKYINNASPTGFESEGKNLVGLYQTIR